MMDTFVIGIDYGTDSVRSLLVNAQNGKEIASSVFFYPRWKSGLFCDPSKNQFRQHPLDYIEGLEHTVKDCIEKAGKSISKNIKAISIDTTGSTPVAVDQYGTPLSLLPEFAGDPDGMFILWKDHTAIKEAAEINEHAKHFEIEYLKYVGGIYSSEWFWAKLLHILRNNSSVARDCYSFVEHCDWVPFLLTGGTDVHQMKRGVCAAGHKALWAEEFGGLPPEEFFTSIDPLLKGFTKKLFTKTYTSDKAAGTISKEWADKLGLPETVVIGVGAFDAHMGAVGGEIKPYYLSRVMGTSTCDMLVVPGAEAPLIKGICGQVQDSIIPGMIGMEAGQSAFGDVYAACERMLNTSIQELSFLAKKLPFDEGDELALDWMNGRRAPDADQSLKAALMNINLATDPARIFRAFVESTCFGAKAIMERFNEQGIVIKGLIGLGGVAKKSPYVMQMLSDVTGMNIRIPASDQTCALGAAMFAATACGIYERVEDAMEAMGSGFVKEFEPNGSLYTYYEKRYEQYKNLGRFVEGKKPGKNKSPYQYIKEQAFEANLQLPKLGLVKFTFGNVSAADRLAGCFAIKPSGLPYEQLSPDQMVVVDFEGNVIEGKLRPSSDTKTHAVLYRHWEIGSICHTHSTYATAWAQSLRDIPVFGTTHADHLLTVIPCAPPMSDEMILGDYEYETGFQIMNCLEERGLLYEEIQMILVGNHAPFTWGSSAEKAVYNSAVLEEIAKMAFLTEQINRNAHQLKDSLIKKHYERKHGTTAYYGQ